MTFGTVRRENRAAGAYNPTLARWMAATKCLGRDGLRRERAIGEAGRRRAPRMARIIEPSGSISCTAKHAMQGRTIPRKIEWWLGAESNRRPQHYECRALTV